MSHLQNHGNVIRKPIRYKVKNEFKALIKKR